LRKNGPDFNFRTLGIAEPQGLGPAGFGAIGRDRVALWRGHHDELIGLNVSGWIRASDSAHSHSTHHSTHHSSAHFAHHHPTHPPAAHFPHHPPTPRSAPHPAHAAHAPHAHADGPHHSAAGSDAAAGFAGLAGDSRGPSDGDVGSGTAGVLSGRRIGSRVPGL